MKVESPSPAQPAQSHGSLIRDPPGWIVPEFPLVDACYTLLLAPKSAAIK